MPRGRLQGRPQTDLRPFGGDPAGRGARESAWGAAPGLWRLRVIAARCDPGSQPPVRGHGVLGGRLWVVIGRRDHGVLGSRLWVVVVGGNSYPTLKSLKLETS
ncbi:hypothetical protein PtA15_2A546 [Puccinia triticina]|uniref:Uncharacterized protein n=1 Tax=Puccinia triticina TaxID=208348 RepID=A0ABY7CAQ7_9BASI|nr:uncharacterized protein PtA15_2A546 [Puccinia triticina]WAQ82229.1 hypothetical protein PtA15_2A546 [Puccinia triticina]